jgi:hypothetical protein
VSGSELLSVTATDNQGVVGVQFQLDGADLGAELTSPPFELSWDTSTVPNATYAVTAVARDAAGQTAQDGVDLEVDNVPTLTVSGPVAGALIEGSSVPVSYSLGGDLAEVVHVRFQLDGGPIVTDTDQDGSLVLSSVASGPHGLDAWLARADDSVIVGTEVTRAFDTLILPPTLSLVSPVEGGVIGGDTVAVSYGLGGDLSEVAAVDLTLDGGPLVQDTDLDGSYAFAGVSEGAHSLTVELSRGDGSPIAGSQTTVSFTTSTLQVPGLVAAFGFEGEDGTSALDATGQGHTATCPAGSCPSYLPTGGHGGSAAYDFAGSGNYLELASEGDFDFTGPFALTLWLRSPGFTNAYEQFVGKGDSAWAVERDGSLRVAGFTTFSPGSHVVKGTSSIDDGAWHHIAVVYDGAQKQLWVDGVLERQLAFSSAVSVNDQSVRFGQNSEYPTGDFGGVLDDVRIYDRALTPAEIASDSTTPIGP